MLWRLTNCRIIIIKDVLTEINGRVDSVLNAIPDVRKRAECEVRCEHRSGQGAQYLPIMPRVLFGESLSRASIRCDSS